MKRRGTLKEGYAADVVVFDADTIDRGAERAVFDMPGDGMRYVRDSVGIDTVIVNGEVAWKDGEYLTPRAGVICTG
jgi:N-acyl-D-aspartate/D-glutamate deacylase